MASQLHTISKWKVAPFDKLSAVELHGLLKVRVDVFVVEQNCAYHEIDGKDPDCDHVTGSDSDGTIAATARIAPPGLIYPEPSIGRVAILKEYRGHRAGYDLMKIALRHCRSAYGDLTVKIAAQQYLEGFYNALGFHTESEPFDWDGIPHVYMYLRDWPTL